MTTEKTDQTIYERAEIGERVIFKIRELLKNVPIDVIGHLDLTAVCCRNGTVAIVKVDLDELATPKGPKKTSSK
jgi:hypothetical protein